MATICISSERVSEAADKRAVSLQAEWDAEREAYISKPRTVTEGWLWWKTQRQRTRAECEYLFQHGCFEDEDRHFRWPMRLTLEDRYAPNIRKAQRLARAARENAVFYVRLDEDEVAFLKLLTKTKE